MSQKNVAVCWLVKCLSNKTGSCSSNSPFLTQSQALCQPHIQIKSCLWLPVPFSDLFLGFPADLCGQPYENSVSTNTQHAVCKYIYIQIESITTLDCAILGVLNKTVFSIFKTVWPWVLRTVRVLQSSFRSRSRQSAWGRGWRHPLPPARCAPSSLTLFLLARRRKQLHRRGSAGCVCCETICSSGSAGKEQK